MQALLRPTDSISIHSLVKRETSFRILHFPQCTDFNPLPRKEGDAKKMIPDTGNPISIHSLVKRETKHLATQLHN